MAQGSGYCCNPDVFTWRVSKVELSFGNILLVWGERFTCSEEHNPFCSGTFIVCGGPIWKVPSRSASPESAPAKTTKSRSATTWRCSDCRRSSSWRRYRFSSRTGLPHVWLTADIKLHLIEACGYTSGKQTNPQPIKNIIRASLLSWKQIWVCQLKENL